MSDLGSIHIRILDGRVLDNAWVDSLQELAERYTGVPVQVVRFAPISRDSGQGEGLPTPKNTPAASSDE